MGGDRFAANVVAMPHGLYYGQVTPPRAAELVAAHERGEVLPDLLRGRTTTPPVVQAAMAHVRLSRGEARLDAFRPGGALPLGGGRWQVRLRTEGSSLVVTLRSGARPAAGLLPARHRPGAPAGLRAAGRHRGRLSRSRLRQVNLGGGVLAVRGGVVADLAEPVVAVAARVLVQVALVVVLGVPERAGLGRGPDLGRDLAVPGLLERLLVAPPGRLGGEPCASVVG